MTKLPMHDSISEAIIISHVDIDIKLLTNEDIGCIPYIQFSLVVYLFSVIH
jgi:hypothetical protein